MMWLPKETWLQSKQESGTPARLPAQEGIVKETTAMNEPATTTPRRPQRRNEAGVTLVDESFGLVAFMITRSCTGCGD